jgi:hypothetical protein
MTTLPWPHSWHFDGTLGSWGGSYASQSQAKPSAVVPQHIKIKEKRESREKEETVKFG